MLKETAKSKSVLIIEDDDDICAILAEFFRYEGVEAITALNGQAAIQFLSSNPPPDLILTDLSMPGMAGDELIHKLRENPKTKAIPVIVSSAAENIVEYATKIGAQGYLKKPFKLTQISELIENYLK